MVTAAEIRDEDSLRAWLEGRSHEDAVAIAARAALRVAPLYWGFNSLQRRSKPGVLIAFLRISLLSTLAVSRPKPSVVYAAAIAFGSRDAIGPSDHEFVDNEVAGANGIADLALLLAAEMGRGARPKSSSESTFSGPLSSRRSWRALAMDAADIEAGRDPFARPLWPEGPPDGIAMVHHRDWRARGGGWEFWADWYEGYLTGKPLDIDLLEQVSLIEPEEWDKGETQVSGMIAGYYRDFRIDRAIRETPYSLRVEFNGQKGKLEAFAVDTIDAAEVEGRVRQAMKDFTARCRADRSPNRMLQILDAACGDPIRDLRRDLSRYKDNVVGLYDSLMAAQKALHQAAAANGMEREANLLRLVDTLDTCAKDLSGSAPALLDVLRRRASVDLARVRQEQMQMMVRLCTGMKQDSDGYLEFACQIALTAILSSTDEGERQSAWMFMEAMVPRGARAMIAAHEEGEPRRRKSLGQRIKETSDVIVAADKIADIGQEVAQELPGWVEAASDVVGRLP